MSEDVIEALERTLAELRPAEDREAEDPEALGLCVAELAWELALADTPRSHELTAWAEALDGAHDLVRVRAKARRNRAYYARFTDDLEVALTLASEAATLAESLGEVRDRAAAEDTLANVHSTLGAFDLALAHSLTSIELNRKVGDRRGLAWSFENVARVHRHLGDLDEARRWIDQAIEIFNEIGHTVGRARSFALLANILREMGDLAGAQAALEEAQPLWEESGLESGLRWGQIALARVLRDRGEHGAALDTVRGAIEGSAERLARPGAAERLSTDLLTAASTCEGALLLDLGRAGEAEEALIQALALASPERRLEDIIECHALLGELYEARGDPARALLHVKERLRLVDTRSSNPARRAGGSGGPIAAGGTARYDVGGAFGIPAAAAVVSNATAVSTGAAGFVTTWDCAATRPTSSHVNYDASGATANLSQVAANANGELCSWTLAASHLIVDVFGIWQ